MANEPLFRDEAQDPARQAELDAAHFVSPEPIDASSLTIERTTRPGRIPPNQQLVFGKTFADHMLEIDWTKGEGWGAPRIRPYGPLVLDPSCTVFHYGAEVFEGMKAYKDSDGQVRLFRPDMNMARMNRSCARLCLPNFEPEGFLRSLEALMQVDERWIPSEPGYSLYVRPTMIGTQPSLGVAPCGNARLFVITGPVGPYYPTGFKPVKLLASRGYVRAWPGGTGNAKVGGNYAPGLLPQMAANEAGYAQVMWLFRNERGQDEITEVGTMNLFVLWKNEDGESELVTPELDGTILPGVTRDTVLSLAREWGDHKVSERKITMQEFVKALREDRVIECFGSGTAAIVSPVNGINYEGVDHVVPVRADDPDADIGVYAERLVNEIMGIQYGEIPHEWSHVVPSAETPQTEGAE